MTEPDQNHVGALDLYTFSDLDQLLPDETTEVILAFRNDGAADWDGEYTLVYTDESHAEAIAYPHTLLASRDSFALAELGAAGRIVPGDTAYLSLPLTAPKMPGVYVTGWQMQAPSGERFGPVAEARVVVIEPPGKGLDELSYQLVTFVNSAANKNSMSPGEAFIGTWTLRNTSFQAWEGDFRIVYSAANVDKTVNAISDPMGVTLGRSLWELAGRQRIQPGEEFIVRLNFVAPKTPGFYAFHWQIVGPSGAPISGTRWMTILVAEVNGTAPPPPTLSSGGAGYVYRGPQVTFFTGIHGPADDWRWNSPQFQEMMKKLNMPVFFMSHGINPDFGGMGDRNRNVVRLVWNPRAVSADVAYEELRDDAIRRWWDRGYRRFVFFNEPQLHSMDGVSKEGFGTTWHSAEEFARFLKTNLIRARQDFPGIFLYTTPMTSNAAFDPWKWYAVMWAEVRNHVDGWCMHAYSGNNGDANAAAQDIADQVVEVQRRMGLQIPIIVSEASVNRGGDANQKARAARLLPGKLAHVPGVEGIFWFAADWDEGLDKNNEGWFRKGIAQAYLNNPI